MTDNEWRWTQTVRFAGWLAGWSLVWPPNESQKVSKYQFALLSHQLVFYQINLSSLVGFLLGELFWRGQFVALVVPFWLSFSSAWAHNFPMPDAV